MRSCSYRPPEGAVHHVLFLTSGTKSDFVPLSFKDPGQEALIIKPLIDYVFSTTIPLFCCTLQPLISIPDNINIKTTISLLNCNYILLRHYISCPSRGNGQFHCKSSKNQCCHIKQFKIAIRVAVIQKGKSFELTKPDTVLDVPVCNSVLAEAS